MEWSKLITRLCSGCSSCLNLKEQVTLRINRSIYSMDGNNDEFAAHLVTSSSSPLWSSEHLILSTRSTISGLKFCCNRWDQQIHHSRNSTHLWKILQCNHMVPFPNNAIILRRHLYRCHRDRAILIFRYLRVTIVLRIIGVCLRA